MKKSVILIFIFIVIISTKFSAQSVGIGNADPSVFSKFRIPETNLSSLWFNSNFNFNSGKSIESSIGTDYFGRSYFNSNDSYSSNLQYH